MCMLCVYRNIVFVFWCVREIQCAWDNQGGEETVTPREEEKWGGVGGKGNWLWPSEGQRDVHKEKRERERTWERERRAQLRLHPTKSLSESRDVRVRTEEMERDWGAGTETKKGTDRGRAGERGEINEERDDTGRTRESCSNLRGGVHVNRTQNLGVSPFCRAGILIFTLCKHCVCLHVYLSSTFLWPGTWITPTGFMPRCCFYISGKRPSVYLSNLSVCVFAIGRDLMCSKWRETWTFI